MEDINFFLKVAQKYPIYFHNQILFEYRYHGSNLSAKSAAMLISAMHAHSLQWSYVEQSGNQEYLAAYERGKQAWITLFAGRLPYAIMGYIREGRWVAALGALRLILNYDPKLKCIDRDLYEVSYKALLSQLQKLPIQSSLTYWKQQLTSAPPLLSLPTDRPRPAEQNERGSAQSFVVSQELTQALSLLSKQEGVTLFMTLLAAFDTLLYRYTGTEDIVVGSPIASRVDSEIFVNAVALRTDMSGNPRFQELLERVRKVTFLAQSYQDLPFELLVEELQPQRDLSYSPLFQVMFVMEEDISLQKVEISSLTASPWVVEEKRAKFDLTLFLEQTNNELVGKWVYNTDLFDADTIERMNGHFQTMLVGIVAHPEQPISELPLLTAEERQQLLIEWNHTQADYPRDRCIHQLFEEQVKRTPNAVAVVFEQQQLTYWELNSRANQLAHYLKTLGVGSDVPVGICVERSLEMVVGLLGILKAGGAYIPLDPAYPKERLAYMLSDSQLPVLLTHQDLVSVLPQHQAKVICLDTDWKNIAEENDENPLSGVTVENRAYIIYTSGSTGKPKGVQIIHQAVTNFLNSMQLKPGLTDKDIFLAITTISFDIAVLELYLPLMLGAQVVLASREVAVDGMRLLKLLNESKATVMQATPATWHLLLAAGWNGQSQLKILCGGEALSQELASQLLARVSSVWNMYGPTEATVWATTYEVQQSLVDTQKPAILIGKPIANTQTYILDQYLQPVPIGINGELYIGGVCLAKGYLNRPDLTTEKFIANPFLNSSIQSSKLSRLYKTGDLARYLPNGDIEYISRIDNQVKIRGFRIELGEIEVLLAKRPEIQEIAVIVREDVPGDKRLVAYIVPKQDQTPTVHELRDFLSQNLPKFMIPSAFVTLDTLPLTPNGKVDRRALLGYSMPSDFVSLDTTTRADNGEVDSLVLPNTSRISLDTASVAPRDELERRLTEIWEKVLGIRPIGIRDNFFELGGHSLIAMRMFNEIEQIWGKNLPLTTLFQTQTVENLAGVLREEGCHEPWSSLVLIQPGGDKPPLFCIHPIGGNVLEYYNLAYYLGREQSVYGLQAQGLDGIQPPLTRIEDMASLYIKEIRTIQPNGPYFLTGYSFGGVVAFEMAQQLYTQGQKVALLALLDAKSPNLLDIRPSFAESVQIHLSNLCQLEPHERLKYVSDRIEHRFRKVNYRDFLIRALSKNGILTSQYLKVLDDHLQASKDYVAQVYPGVVTLFRCQVQLLEFALHPGLGWDEVVNQDLEIHHIPGDHFGLLKEPRIQVLAEKLKFCLERLQADE